jgi:hypothetical protein
MSRAYRIRISERVTRLVKVNDGLSTKVTMLPLLSKPRMTAHLAQALIQAGFTLDGEGEGKGTTARRNDGEGMAITITLDTGEVSITIESQREVSAQGSVLSGRSESATRRAQEKAKAAAEAVIDRSRKAIEAEATERLLRQGQDFQQELEMMIHKATGEALKERARELGTIESMVEGKDGSMTLRVRL